MNKKRLFFISILSFWAIAIIGFITIKEEHKATGDVFYFKTMPVDPRDLFRGDYVNLSYEISSLDIEPKHALYKDIENLMPGDKVYVILQNEYKRVPVDNAFETKWIDVTKTFPESGYYIAGTIEDVQKDLSEFVNIRVSYGIESFFVPQHTGKDIEQYVGKELYGKVVVNSNGNAMLDALILNGEEL